LPTVTGVSIPDPSPGVPVTVAYTYNGNATIPDRSKFQWYTATAADGSGKVLIAGATDKTYTSSASDAGKYLVAEVTPASYDTVVGTPVTAVSSSSVAPVEQPFPTGTTLEANGRDFGIDSGFPATGFSSAKFQVQISGNPSNNSGYTWSSDQSWVSVDSSGNVKFTGVPTSSTKSFKIKAKRTSDGSVSAKSFTLRDWYRLSSNAASKADATATCSQTGSVLATVNQLNGASHGTSKYGNGVRGTIGSLWSEWGSLMTYPSSGAISNMMYWTSEMYNSSSTYTVFLDSGSYNITNINIAPVCRQSL
ncbi:hypothetical protein NNO07_27770, partial [Pseudomonas resinovorans]